MRKKAIVLGVVWMLGASSLAACGQDKDDVSKQQESEESEEKEHDPSALQSYEDVLDVLCQSKIDNDVESFLNLVDYMRATMESVITEDDYFSTISAGYKEECGGNITWDYEITNIEESTDEDIASYMETVELFGGNKMEVKEAYEITAQVHLKGDSGNKDYDLELAVGKVGDKWQIVNFGETLLK